jgi:hypothetical protein
VNAPAHRLKQLQLLLSSVSASWTSGGDGGTDADALHIPELASPPAGLHMLR